MNSKKLFSLAITVVAIVCLTACAALDPKAQSDKIAQQEKTFQQKQAQLETELNATTKVVYAKNDLPDGKTLKATDIGEREVPHDQAPIDALSAKSQAIGRKIKHELSKDDVLCQHRLLPIPPK